MFGKVSIQVQQLWFELMTLSVLHGSYQTKGFGLTYFNRTVLSCKAHYARAIPIVILNLFTNADADKISAQKKLKAGAR